MNADSPRTRSPTRLSGVATLLGSTAWAVREATHRQLVQDFNTYLKAGPAAEGQLEHLRAAREHRADTLQEAQQQAPGISILSLYGTILPRGNMMVELCGAASPHSFAEAVLQAANDPNIASIILDIDSGGGAVSGIDVAADAVRRASALKPVTALCNTTCCSAAYWIAAQAREVVITPAGEIGSIGVIGTHTDQSAVYDEVGIKVTYVRSTPGKALGQPTEAMDGAVLDEWQSQVDRLHTLFVESVAAGRGRTAKDVREKWATGAVWFGAEGVTAGLADRVGTLSEVIASHLSEAAKTQAQQGRAARRAQDSTYGRLSAELGRLQELPPSLPARAAATSLHAQLTAQCHLVAGTDAAPDYLVLLGEAGHLTSSAAFQAGAGPSFDVGARIRVTVPPHMEGHDSGEVREAVLTYAYGVVFDGMEDMGVHHWYIESELAPEPPDAAPPADDSTDAAKKKKRKKPMPGMDMAGVSMDNITLITADGTAHEVENTPEALQAFLAAQSTASADALTTVQTAHTARLAQIGGLFGLTAEQATAPDLSAWEVPAAQAAQIGEYRAALLAELGALAVTVDGSASAHILKLAGNAPLADLQGTVSEYRDRRDALVPAGRQSSLPTPPKEEVKPAAKPNFDRN